MKRSLGNKLLVLLMAALMLLSVSPMGAMASGLESGETPAMPVEEVQPEAISEEDSEILPETETESDEPMETTSETDETTAEETTETEAEETTEPAPEAVAVLEAESETETETVALEGEPATKIGRVHVVVENTTFLKPVDGKEPAWTGTLVDEWVDLMSDSTMMSCVVAALSAKGYTQKGAENDYISEINGLAEFHGGSMSGWMGTLNDWFVNAAFSAFTVASGKLAADDEIRIMYSSNGYGEDLGQSWSNSDKTIKDITVSAGDLLPAFDKNTHSYRLTIDDKTESVVVTPTASNKAFQVRTSVNGTEYKRTKSIPVTDGTVITVKCGTAGWPTITDASAQVYTINVVREKAQAQETVTIRSQMMDSYLHGITETTVASDLAESYGYADKVKGVSALDVLVKAHELVFGEDVFTAETAAGMLAVSDTGLVSMAFGLETTAFGFMINGGYPNDGKPSPYGGYNGTYLTTQRVIENDVVDFFLYQDPMWQDQYTWVTAPALAAPEQSLSVQVKGIAIGWEGYNYKTPAALKEAAMAVKGAKLVWIDGTTGAATDTGAVTDQYGRATVAAPKEAGSYLLSAVSGEAVYALLNPCTVTVSAAPATSIRIEYAGALYSNGTKVYGKNGDTIAFRAVDQEGKEAKVTWTADSTSTWGEFDKDTGIFTMKNISAGSSKTLKLTAVLASDPSIKSSKTSFTVYNYDISDAQKTQTITLSEDGQTTKTATVKGGVSGQNVWTNTIAGGIAAYASDPGTADSAKFNCLRPGSFTATVGVKGYESQMSATATITIEGVAVADADGKMGQTRLEVSHDTPAATVQLAAYAQDGRSIAKWESSNTSVASVSEDGLVTAHKAGMVIITATDSKGAKGGIKVIVTDADTPYFEALELSTTAVADWVKDKSFQATVLEYNVAFRAYSTSTLALQNSTKYDAEKYQATARYVNADGAAQEIAVKNEGITQLTNMPFGKTKLTITLESKTDAAVKTEYVFYVTRPRDETKALKTTSGLVLAADGRELLATKYKGQAEGAMFQLKKGAENGKVGVAAGITDYRAYLLNGTKRFSLKFTGSTNYVHMRWSADGGATWSEPVQQNGETAVVEAAADGTTVLVQVLDDKTYVEKGSFDASAAVEYSVNVVPVSTSLSGAQILTAQCDGGDFYPVFDPELSSYTIIVPNGVTGAELRYTVAEGAAVKVGSAAQKADENGVYTLALTTSAKTITVTSADGSISTEYKFKIQAKSKYAVPDAVVDYLCIGSQYTNGSSYGVNPESTLAGSTKSLGNFGGYITYYYKNAITDDPNNKYGIDFYVYGNAFESGGSAAEPGQVYVSADGENWYALAGSEHYEDTAIWDYTITYTKGDDGKSYWTDNQGNTMANAAKAWPNRSTYYFNDVWAQDSYRFTGIVLKSQEDGTIMGSGTTASFAAAASFGYVDYYQNGTIRADVNPYVAEPDKANGFDLAWAVDAQGNPVQLGAIHYIRVATASNIWAGGYYEKSTEVSYVVRTTAQSAPVGETALPQSITLSDGDSSKTVTLKAGQQTYPVSAAGMTNVSVTVNGAVEDANVYVNNRRVAAGAASDALTIPSGGTKLVRVIVQQGDSEPAVVMLKIADGMDEQDLAAVANVDALINAIGTVTLESGEKIAAARAAYEELGAAQKALVSAYDALKTAEKTHGQFRYEKAYQSTGNYMAALGTPGVGSVGGEWMVIGFGRSGRSVPAGYYAEVVKYVVENADKNGRLNANRSTDNARLILALTAIGKDATNVAGVDLLGALDEMSYIAKQGINGPIWALIALDSHDYPAQGDVTRAALCAAILAEQLPGGGWTLSGDVADPDMTAMALQALAPYYGTGDAAVDAAVNKALSILSAQQGEDGGFTSWGTANSESCAQVLTALTALGIDPTADERFVKNGRNVIDALCAFAMEDGGFEHTTGGGRNGMATEQGYYALASYFRLKNKQTSLYDMTDVVIAVGSAAQDVEALIDAIGTVTPESGAAIETARKAFDGLSKADKNEVGNLQTLEAAEAAYADIVEQLENVIDRIEAIGDAEKVTVKSKDAIEAARKAYDALSEELKALVTNYAKLTAAERRLAALDPQGGTKVIGTGSTKLVLDGVTYMVDAEAAGLMKRIAELRDAGGMDDDGILDAYRTYADMSSELKAQVFNYADLQALCTALGVRGHRDGMSGIKAEGLPWYVGLEVAIIADGDDYDAVAGSIGHNELLALWHIEFINRLTGEVFTPYENVTLRVDAPGYDAALEQFRMALYADGRVAYSDCTVSGGELSWSVLDGGVYGFIGGKPEAEATLELAEETETAEPEDVPEETPAAEPVAAEPVESESASLAWLWVAVGVVGVALLIVVIVLKKRDRERQSAAKH